MSREDFAPSKMNNDPAGPRGDLPEWQSKMKRLPIVEPLQRQIDRCLYYLSTGDPAASHAISAFKGGAWPYLRKVAGWAARWEHRKVASVVDRASGRAVEVPQPQDNQAAFELIMEGLDEAGVIFEDVRVSKPGQGVAATVLVVGADPADAPGSNGRGPHP